MIGAGVVGYAVEARHFAECMANGTMQDRGRLVDFQGLAVVL
jgi:hypothetical protein